VTEQDRIMCHRLDLHEGIDAPCAREAQLLWEDDADGYRGAMVVCFLHGMEQMQYCLRHVPVEDFSIRSLTHDDRRMYLAGAHYALNQTVTVSQAMAALNEDWAAAGLSTPENSGHLFDIGWQWTMIHRLRKQMGVRG
jgi:hypothetical protein